ncbi:pre-mRNA 3' end processing protein WDR33 [Amphibalanus amphitrite]|uniref:Pre-mRNA 3' end processing protein WDR33 n=1 Tax=Amphibalanus amphitrite TaxID=1232801 RepID=A0A6A4WCB9_AMPAM|nr:pre-mRNA 3' end processing protein WDR33 [Amphibalanus amphitrite]KAF0305378.1 pre-mRNA 3' end processing protein WDR33 [Amphibalanus amphitrite]
MIQTSMPPPSSAPSFQYHAGGGGGSGNPNPPHFRGYTPVVYNGKPTMNQEEYDGKRLRKSSMRKTVDYNCSVMKYLEDRIWQRSAIDRPALQPDVLFYPELLPPAGSPDNPINAVTTRFVRTATNKMRCPIFCLAWTPEGRRLITGASSGEFTLWNGLTFNFETILQAHDSPVRTMIWSRNDQWMVTGDHGGYIKYWQMNMNNVKMFQAHKDPLRGISFSPSDTKLCTCSDDGTVRIWDFIRCYEEKVLRGHGADVKCCDWHPYKGLVVSGSKDNQQPVRLWDPKSGQSLATLHAHKSTVMDLKFNRNGNWLLTGSRDHLIKLFDIRNLSEEVQVFRGHKREAASLSWHPIHETLFSSGGSDGSLMFWNVGCDKEVGCIEQAHDSLIWSMSWHPLGHVLASGSNDHTTKFWTRNRPAEEGADSSAGGSEAPLIPGMGPEDRVEPPAGQEGAGKGPAPGEGAPGAGGPPGPDGDRRFAQRRPPWKFASHWNERWLHQEDPSTAGDDKGPGPGGWRGGRGGWRGRGGRGAFRPPGDRDREDIKDRDGRPRDADDRRPDQDQAARDADMRPVGGDPDRDMRGGRGRFGPGPPGRGGHGARDWGRDDNSMQMDPPNGIHDGGPPGRGRPPFRGDRGGFRGGFRGAADRPGFGRGGGDRPGFGGDGGDRPGFGGGNDRPGLGGGVGGDRPGFGGDRPGFGGDRPGFGGGVGGDRPGFGGGVGGDRPGFGGDRPGFGGDRPGFGGDRPGFGGGNDRPGFGGGGIDRPGFDSDGRPGFDGGRPGFDGGRPGFDGGRPGFDNGPRDREDGRPGPPDGRPGPPDGWMGRGGRGGGPPPQEDSWRGRGGGRGGGPPRDEPWRDGRPEPPPDDRWRARDGGPPPPRDDGWRGGAGGVGAPPPQDGVWASRGGGRGGGPPPSDGWRGGAGGPPPPDGGWSGGGAGGPPQEEGWMNRARRRRRRRDGPGRGASPGR